MFCIIFLVCLRFTCSNGVITKEPPCELNVNLTEKLSSLALNNIMTNRSCFAPMATTNTMENIDNAKEFNIEEEEGSKDKHEIHGMPLAWVINQGHLFHKVLPIHALEDPYMILLLG